MKPESGFECSRCMWHCRARQRLPGIVNVEPDAMRLLHELNADTLQLSARSGASIWWENLFKSGSRFTTLADNEYYSQHAKFYSCMRSLPPRDGNIISST